MITGFLHPDGDMDTAAGLRKLQQAFKNQGRAGSQKVAVLVTDGSSRSQQDTARVWSGQEDNAVCWVKFNIILVDI